MNPSAAGVVSRRSFLALAASLSAGPLKAQGLPQRPTELVVSFQPGGGVDTLARVFADIANSRLSHPVVVVNKPGASGAIGLAYAAQGPVDGSRVAMVFAELLTIPLLGLGKVSHEDFHPIAKFASDPSTVTVRAEAPWRTLEEFLEAAKRQPGSLTMSNAGNGSISHIAADALGQRASVRFVHVAYQGSAPAVVGVLGGQVDATAVNYSVIAPHVAAGKLRVLATMADQRFVRLPDVPTLRERGIDVAVDVWRGMAVGRAVPSETVAAWRALAREVAADPRLAETLRKQNLTLTFEDGETFARTLVRESERFRQMLAGMR